MGRGSHYFHFLKMLRISRAQLQLKHRSSGSQQRMTVLITMPYLEIVSGNFSGVFRSERGEQQVCVCVCILNSINL